MLENARGIKSAEDVEHSEKTKVKFKDIVYSNIKEVVLYLICLFVSRSSIMGELFPCSISFLCAYYHVKGPSILALILSVFAIASVTLEFKYIGICVFIYLYYLLLKNKKRTKLIYDVFGFSIILFTINTIIMMYNGFKFNVLLVNIFEILFIVSSTFIFREVVISVKKNNFNIDSTACLLAVIFISVLGFREIQLLDFNVLMFLIFFSIIFVSSYISPFAGMILGIFFGLFNYAKLNISAYHMLALGFGGLCCGLLKNKYKPLCGLLFTVLSTVILLYFENITLYLENVVELGLAVVTYTIISFSFNERLNKLISTDNYYEKKANEAVMKLTKLSSAINELTLAYKEHSDTKHDIDEKFYESSINSVRNTTCSECSCKQKCWEGNYNHTYYSFLKTASNILKNRSIADGYLKKECSNYKNIVKDLGKILKDINPIKTKIEKDSNQKSIINQLEEASDILSDTITEMNYLDINSKTAKEKISEILKEEEIFIKSIEVNESKNSLGVIFTITTDRSIIDISSIVSDAIYKITGNKMKCTERIISAEKFYILRFNVLQKISAKVYYANLTKEDSEISGDNYSYGNTDNKFYSMLCDGMGTGARAFNESKSTISLLIKLLEANFNEKQMINTLNSLLLMKLEDDRYVTLDLSILDYENHELRVYKAGAAQSYLISGNSIKKIESSSLPIGILEEFDCYCCKLNVHSGDTFIMMTDGIVDSINEDEQKSLDSYIDLIKHKDPQHIANSLLTYAVRGCNKVIDDMTVLAIKIM